MIPPKHLRIKCVRPLAHNPQFEGKLHCKHCARDRKPEWQWATQWRDTQAYALFIESGCTHEEAMALIGLKQSEEEE